MAGDKRREVGHAAKTAVASPLPSVGQPASPARPTDVRTRLLTTSGSGLNLLFMLLTASARIRSGTAPLYFRSTTGSGGAPLFHTTTTSPTLEQRL